MKINPESLILNENLNIKIKCILLSGNENTLITKIKKIFLEKLNQKGFSEITTYEDTLIDSGFETNRQNSLFSSKKILIYKNPIIKNIQSIEKINFKDTVLILECPKIKSNNKIKKIFDESENFISIACYQLSKQNKTNILNNYLKKNSISMDSDAYWFFVDKTDSSYQLFENEIEKLKQYQNNKAPLNEIKLMLSEKTEEDIFFLFFLINSSPQEIIKSSTQILNVQSNSVILLQKIKFFLEIFTDSKINGNKTLSLPPYMFKEKTPLQEIYKKINIKKIQKIFSLIKKIELIQRKYPELHQSTSQRFLLNLRKLLNS